MNENLKQQVEALMKANQAYEEKCEALDSLYEHNKIEYRNGTEKLPGLLQKINQIFKRIPVEEQNTLFETLLQNNMFKEAETINNTIPNFISSQKFREFVNKGSTKEWSVWLTNSSFINLLETCHHDNQHGRATEENQNETIKINLNTQEQKNILQIAFAHHPTHSFIKRFDGFISLLENKNEFIKEFIINNTPHTLFYNHHHIRHILPVSSFSAQEIFTAFQNIQEKNGFLNTEEINDSFSFVFQQLHENYILHGNNTYIDLLEKAKNHSPLLYTIMGMKNSMISGNTIVKHYSSKKQKYHVEEALNKFFFDYFDMTIINQGIEEIFSIMKKNSTQNNNKRTASEIVNSVIFNTFYDDYTIPHNPVTKSFLSEEDSKNLFLLLYNEAPQYVFERRKLGRIKNCHEFFEKNITLFYNKEKIMNFLLPHAGIYPLHLNLSNSNSYAHQLVASYFTTIINHAVKIKDVPTINLIKEKIGTFKDAYEKNSFYIVSRENPNKYLNIAKSLGQNKEFNQIIEKAILKVQLENTLSDSKSSHKKHKI